RRRTPSSLSHQPSGFATFDRDGCGRLTIPYDCEHGDPASDCHRLVPPLHRFFLESFLAQPTALLASPAPGRADMTIPAANRCSLQRFAYPLLGVFSIALLGGARSATATSFTISGSSTTAQTLNASETGTITASGSLTVSGSTVAVTIAGSNATLTNSGTLKQTGNGRAIRDNVGGSNLSVTNNAGALMQTADADVIQMNKTPASVTLNNYGTMTSLNASKGGAQAVDFAAIQSGSNTINNYSTGIMQAQDADAVRPGA